MTDQTPLETHQQATLQELGQALARLRDELAWTTRELQHAQVTAAEAIDERDRLRDRVEAMQTSATWRVGRLVVGPIGRLRRSNHG